VFCSFPSGSYVVKETNPSGFVDVSDTEGDYIDSTINVDLGPREMVTFQDFVDELDELPFVAPTESPTFVPTSMSTSAPTVAPTHSSTAACIIT
jgi:hypothetical protein